MHRMYLKGDLEHSIEDMNQKRGAHIEGIPWWLLWIKSKTNIILTKIWLNFNTVQYCNITTDGLKSRYCIEYIISIHQRRPGAPSRQVPWCPGLVTPLRTPKTHQWRGWALLLIPNKGSLQPYSPSSYQSHSAELSSVQVVLKFICRL